MAIRYWLRMERGAEDRMGDPVGPFSDYLQLTYDELTTLDGRTLALFGQDGFWHLNDPALGDIDAEWSDVVIWADNGGA